MKYSDPLRPAPSSLPHVATELKGFARYLQLLDRKGRKGGAIALILGAGVLAGGLGLGWIFFPAYGRPIHLFELGAGVLMCGAGLLAIGKGMRSLVQPRAVRDRPSREAFLALLRKSQKPLRVCTDCRLVVPSYDTAECDECLSRGACFVVANDEDVRIVGLALPPERG
jgi:hypothetical protein